MSEKITAMIEEIKGLTVLELSELVHALEEEFGVSAAAMAAPAAGAAAPAAEEKTEFDVVLAGFDADQKIIIRCRHILEFIPRQLLCHFLHDSDFHAVRLILVIHIVVWEIVRRVRDLHDFLSIGRYSSRCSLVCLFTAASCKPSRDSHDACQNECFP